MANGTDDYESLHHMRRDIREAHTNSHVAKLLSYLALAGMVISLGLAIWALDQAGEAQSTANRTSETVRQLE